MKVFEYFSEFPSLSNYKMTDESRKVAEDNYQLFLCLFNKYKKRYSIIDDSDFDEHIDIFYLCYCKQCHVYVMKQEDRHKLSTYLDKAFKAICEHALRHYNTDYMQQWRNNIMIPLDRMTDTETYIGEFTADERINISEQCETAEMLNNILTYVDNQIQTTKKNIRHFDCSGWLVFKEWYTNSFANTTQFLDYLKNEGLATEDTTEIHIHKVLSCYRRKLKEALKRGEV